MAVILVTIVTFAPTLKYLRKLNTTLETLLAAYRVGGEGAEC